MTAATDALASGLAALAEAVRAAATDPADAVRMLSALAAYTVTPLASTAPIGGAIADAQTAAAAAARRAALASLARACAAYQPASANEAAALRDQVTALFDAEITVAGDAGDDASYAGLRTLRAAVVQDLNTRAAQLPSVITVTERMSRPSLVCAYSLYGDASRADEIVARNDPVHPGFLPLTLEVLSR